MIDFNIEFEPREFKAMFFLFWVLTDLLRIIPTTVIKYSWALTMCYALCQEIYMYHLIYTSQQPMKHICYYVCFINKN